MNIIYKQRRPSGSINQIYKRMTGVTRERTLTFEVGRLPRATLSHLCIVCGKVGEENVRLYRKKAREIDADFVVTPPAWSSVKKTIRSEVDPGKHKGLLLIGTQQELQGVPLKFQDSVGFSDWFIEDADGDGVPDIPVGRIYGPPETVLYQMDPNIIDSNIAVVFDSEPGRSDRHVKALARLGFDVEVLQRYDDVYARLLSVSEFILQFSDGVYTSRVHGTPDMWATHNSLILAHDQVRRISFSGYPAVYSEACSTAREGALIRAFLDRGACYIGSTLDTINNRVPFDDWRKCAYADGYKFGFLDLLDSTESIGQTKLNVDRSLYENLSQGHRSEIERLGSGIDSEVRSENVLSVLEWVLCGNPLRNTTVGPNADYMPGKIIVDT